MLFLFSPFSSLAGEFDVHFSRHCSAASSPQQHPLLFLLFEPAFQNSKAAYFSCIQSKIHVFPDFGGKGREDKEMGLAV
jgi:hypothetical protein